MNVLILSAAAKVLLVEAFQAAVADRGGRVFAADIAPDSAALHVADQGLILPRSQEPGFIPALKRVCREHRIGLVVPTRDAELPVLAPWRNEFAAGGTTIPVASADTIALCQDKRRFAAFCEAEGFPIARTYGSDVEPARFPIFIRPATGAGGVGARRVDDAEEWRNLGAERAGLIIQDFVEAEEYTVDTLMDLEGHPIQAVARRRLLVRGGEAQKSRVENVPALSDLALALGARLRLVGHNVIQCFRDRAGTPNLIEVNPRFGGASNLSIVAGLDSPRRLVDLVAGDWSALAPRPIRHGLGMLRYSRDVIVEPDEIARLAALH
jgi:carbamoyl-phosphate synthase large subunit